MNIDVGQLATSLATLRALPDDVRRWTRWLSPLGSLVLLVLAARQALKLGPADVQAAFAAPGFAPAVLALYLAPPLADWLIFRRLWRLPAAGVPVVLGKRIVNELFVSYTGELYFYFWARRRLAGSVATFGAVKDVNILSALAGNSFALLLLVPAMPHLAALGLGRYAPVLVWSSVVMLAVSLTIFVLARRLFTLSRMRMAEVFGVHLLRLGLGVVLCALAWSFASPSVPFSAWIALSAIRLLVALVPVAPNRELLFAGVAGLVTGHGGDIASIVALTATSLTALHFIVGLGVGAIMLADPDATMRRPSR